MPDPSTSHRPDGIPPPLAPRAQRGNVFLMAVLEYPDGKAATRHRVRDISTGGIRIDNAGGLRPGATVSISIGALHASGASIRWARDGLAGAAFDEPINPEEARKKPSGISIARGTAAPAVTAPPAPAPAGSAGWLGNMWDPYRR